ncbi:MAG TPA: tetratricopeptide repeat protein [Flavobacteriales bacterium]|nr:tetratricopeptide repeat protein [Flavobacteriales bacterium]
MVRSILLATLLLPCAAIAQRTAEDHLALAQQAYKDTAQLGLALAHADTALSLDANIAGGYKLRGDIKQKKRDMHGALMDYTRAAKQEPDNSRLYVSRSAVHISEGQLKEAVRDADMAIKLDPNDADAWYNRACANYIGRNNEGALHDLERAMKLRPEFAEAIFLRGVVRGEQYKEASGLVDIEEALRLNPDIPGGRMSAGVLLFESERYEEAIVRFTEVIALEEELEVAHYYRGDCYYHLQDKEKACIDWRRSAELGDKDAQFIVRNYCNTDAESIPKKPQKRRDTVIEF